jgi:putative ABC transport system permease protein
LPVRRGDATDNAQILGESERWQRVWNRSASRGDCFDEAAVRGSARVAVIGETVAQDLFGNDDPIGAGIQIGSVPFKVIGVLEPWGTDPHGMDEDNVVVVPVTTLMRRLANLDKIGMAKLLVSDPGQAEQMKVQIAEVLRQRHALSRDQPDDFSILTATEVHRVIEGIQRVIFLYLPLVAAVSLVVGGIVSASLVLSSINDRIGEIGLRRAVGAHSADIRLQFLLETTTTIVVGGLLGIALGYAAAEIAANRMHLGSANPWLAAALGIAASVAVGLLAGVLPALRAARLEPAEALR